MKFRKVYLCLLGVDKEPDAACFLFLCAPVFFAFYMTRGTSSSSSSSTATARLIASSLLHSLRSTVGPNFFFFSLIWGYLENIVGANTTSKGSYQYHKQSCAFYAVPRTAYAPAISHQPSHEDEKLMVSR